MVAQPPAASQYCGVANTAGVVIAAATKHVIPTAPKIKFVIASPPSIVCNSL